MAMNPPFDHQDLLLRNQLLCAATKRSSSMLQQAASDLHHLQQRDLLNLPTNTPQPLVGTQPRFPLVPDPMHYGLPVSADPEQYSLERLRMLRSQAHDSLAKMQHESLYGLAPPPSAPPVPHHYTPFTEMDLRRSLPTGHVAHATLPAFPDMETRHEQSPRQRSTPYSDITAHLPSSGAVAAPALGQTAPKKPSTKSGKSVTKKKKKTKADKIARGIGKKDAKWLVSLQQLVEYREEFGDCIVPRGYSPNPRLASWVAEQRKQYKLLKDGKPSSITEARIQRLNDIDFAWNAQDAAWDRHLEDLKSYKKKHGDCLVPIGDPDFPKLGLWIKEQRRHYALMKQEKPSHMTEERALGLDRIGFCWDTHEAIWAERLRELSEYRAEHGDCLVPTSYSKNPKLGTWVHHQRRQFKKFKDGKDCHITIERIRALDSIGFAWNPKAFPKLDRQASSASDDNPDTDSEDLSDTSSTSSELRPTKRARI